MPSRKLSAKSPAGETKQASCCVIGQWYYWFSMNDRFVNGYVDVIAELKSFEGW